MLYRLILRLRHKAWDSGRRKAVTPDTPTVCVGNVTAGGTGKTPCTEMLLQMLADEGLRPAVLSRGYRRKTKGYLEVTPDSTAADCGDEPLQMKRGFPNVTVAVDRNRIEGCARLKADHSPDIIILDDAFQYRALKASLNIVLTDFGRPVFKDKLLPFGRLRDLPERMNAADIVIVTKCPQGIGEFERRAFANGLKLKSNIPVIFTYLKYGEPEGVYPEADRHYLWSSEAVAFSGIASPKPFEEYVRSKYSLKSRLRFADHHSFSRRDIAGIAQMAASNPRAIVLTTRKDAQRLKDADLPADVRKRLFTLPVELDFIVPQDRGTLLQALKLL